MKTFSSLAIVAATMISGILAPQQEAHAASFSETCGVTAKISLIPSPNPTIWCDSRYEDATGQWIRHAFWVWLTANCTPSAPMGQI